MAVFAEAGQDFVCYPAFEGFGFFFAAGEDEGIYSGLGNCCRVLLSARGIYITYTLFVVV